MIRHAEPEDAEEIHDVALKSWKDTYDHILSEEAIEEVIEDWYSVEDLREQTEHPVFYIAEKEDEVVGFVHATVKDRKATLHRIYLDPEYQGQGIGSKLYEKTEKDIKQEADKMELEVLAENQKGNSFYRKQGFEEQETEEIELKGEKAKQKILTKNLKDPKMKITLLGSGDAIGMPTPMCDCEYCQESEKRRRPSLLVETDNTTLVFEMSPDIKEQLHEAEIYEVDAFFITHHHFDHFSGIRELNHIAIEQHILNTEDFDYNGWHGRKITVYGNQTTREYLEEKQNHIAENENINFQEMSDGETVEVGDITVEAFRVEHGEETQGYAIQKDGKKVVYVPDVRNIPEDETCYEDADIAFMEGQLFGAESHGYTEEIEQNIETVDAERTVLVNISEHLNQMHTEEMEKKAEEKGYEIWNDFDSFELGD